MNMLRKMLAIGVLLLPLVAHSGSVVDINTADSEALVDQLVGVGPQKALAMVRYRQQHGPFRNIEDLAPVSQPQKIKAKP